jgi:class 3 adenylate cyclase
VFTDLQGSTKLYDALGDATAFHLVRDHFAFLSERMERHNGFIVKTVGDAVMAAFHDPADAVRAVLSIQYEVADFNRGRRDGGVILKVGLHLGSRSPRAACSTTSARRSTPPRASSTNPAVVR